jgi:hypothetical protein
MKRRIVSEALVRLNRHEIPAWVFKPGHELPMEIQKTMSKTEQSALPVEALQSVLGDLIREREELRTHGADQAKLERNRQAIAKTQWDLSRALIARYRPGPQPA